LSAVNHLFDDACVGGAVGEGVDDDVTLAVDEVEQDEEAFPPELAAGGGGGMMVTVGTPAGLPNPVPPPPSVTE